jgi:hypothetical protein
MSDEQIKYESLLQKPIILFGSGRSGTTIISEILFQHETLAWHSNWQEIFPRSTAINYLRRLGDNKLWRFPVSFVGKSKKTKYKGLLNNILFNPIERYNFWEALTGPRIDFSRGFLLNEKAIPEEIKHIRSFLAKQVKYQNKKRMIAKFTGPGRLEYLTSIFPDAKIIYITREPIATVRSWLEVGFWQTKGINKLWWTGAYSPEEIAEADKLANDPALITAFQYKKLMETTEHEIKKLDLNVLEVRYEDFVKDPRAFIKKLCEFAEMPPSILVDKYLESIAVSNKNERAAKTAKSTFSEETKKKILEIVSVN